MRSYGEGRRMSHKDPIEGLFDLTARLIARGHLRNCSQRFLDSSEPSDSKATSDLVEADHSSTNKSETEREKD